MTRGLRRFVGPRPADSPQRAGEQTGAGDQTGTLEGAAPGEQCEMCSEALRHGHSHVVNVETRRILCTCRGCYLLFTHPGAGGGKHRAIPERRLHAPDFPAGARVWESTGIPVGMAFVFRSSVSGPVAFYPSPAGATESLLPVESWEQALTAQPVFADIATDVEALLLNKCGLDDAEFECFLVPIDTCYELVGLVRSHWRGFDGGTEAWEHIDGFFERLRGRSSVIGAGDD